MQVKKVKFKKKLRRVQELKLYHELVADAVKKYADERQSESPSHLRVYKDAELNEAEQALMQAYISKLAEYSQYIPERDNAKDRGEVRSLSFSRTPSALSVCPAGD